MPGSILFCSNLRSLRIEVAVAVEERRREILGDRPRKLVDWNHPLHSLIWRSFLFLFYVVGADFRSILSGTIRPNVLIVVGTTV